MSIDGKISTDINTPAKFNSREDLRHLETQISLCDAIIFGGNTLRAYGTSLVIKNPQLLKQREERKQPLQPLNIVCSANGNIDPKLRFFSQPLPRGLLTTTKGFNNWQKKLADLNTENIYSYFQKFFIDKDSINWQIIFCQLSKSDYHNIGILGGAKLISSLLAENLINDLWLTICPIIIGKKLAPNFLDEDLLIQLNLPLHLKLLEVKQVNQEVFLHYSIK